MSYRNVARFKYQYSLLLSIGFDICAQKHYLYLFRSRGILHYSSFSWEFHSLPSKLPPRTSSRFSFSALHFHYLLYLNSRFLVIDEHYFKWHEAITFWLLRRFDYGSSPLTHSPCLLRDDFAHHNEAARNDMDNVAAYFKTYTDIAFLSLSACHGLLPWLILLRPRIFWLLIGHRGCHDGVRYTLWIGLFQSMFAFGWSILFTSAGAFHQYATALIYRLRIAQQFLKYAKRPMMPTGWAIEVRLIICASLSLKSLLLYMWWYIPRHNLVGSLMIIYYLPASFHSELFARVVNRQE